LIASLSQAQFLGYVGLQTNFTRVVNVGQSPGRTRVNANIGASTHTFTYCVLGGGTATQVVDLQLFVEESPDGSDATFTQISPTYSFPQSSNGNSCGIIQLGGYYSVLAVNIALIDCFGSPPVPCTTPGVGVSVWYTGTAGPIDVFPPNVNSTGGASGVQCDRSFTLTSVPPGTSTELLVGNPHQAIYVCGGTISFSGATTAGFITLLSADGGAACNPVPITSLAALKAKPVRRQTVVPLIANTPQAQKYTVQVGATTPQLFAINQAPNSFFKIAAAIGQGETPPNNGINLCMVIGPIGASTTLTLNYAQF
jgi:hypothetical protein